MFESLRVNFGMGLDEWKIHVARFTACPGGSHFRNHPTMKTRWYSSGRGYSQRGDPVGGEEVREVDETKA